MNSYKKDFPIFKKKVYGKQLVYLDNAATSQSPLQVINSVVDFESNYRANVHRGIHTLSEEATELYEGSRKTIAEFIHATVPAEIIFVRNETEAANLVAYAWGDKNIQKNDIILVSEIEHHSNLIPWQELAKRKGAFVKTIPVNKDGQIMVKATDVDWGKVKLVAITHVSNVLGVVNDVKEITKVIKKRYKAGQKVPRIFLDGAQAVPHMLVNVQKLGVDFMAFSGHKMCGPYGIGVLWAKREVLEEMDAYLTGGGMINEVTYDSATFQKYPEKYEAGTPNISGAIGLAEACRYLSKIGMDKIYEHEKELVDYAMKELIKRGDVEIYGPRDTNQKAGIISFNLDGVPAHDLAAILDTDGVAIRSGHHCVMPWHKMHKLGATARMSLYFYNDKNDIDTLLNGLDKAKRIFKGVSYE